MPTNVAGYIESALLVFSGVVSEVNAYDVPAGSSPICTDCDFTVQSVKTRDGLANVYSYEGDSIEGVASSGVSFSTDPSENPWDNPDNIASNTPGTYAAVELNAAARPPATIVTEISAGADDITVDLFISGNISVGDVTFIGVSCGSDAEVAGIIDPVGNVWQNVIVAGAAFLWSQATIANDDHNITINFTKTTLSVFSGAQFTGFAPGAFDGLNFFQGKPSGGVIGSGNVTTDADGDMLFSCCIMPGSADTPTPADGATTIASAATASSSYRQAGSAGTYAASWNDADSSTTALCVVAAFEVPLGPSAADTSELLEATAFSLTIPSGTELTGIEVTVNGKQSTTAGETILTILPLTQNFTPTPRTFQLPTSDGSFTIGSPTDEWGEYWTRDQVNNPVFGFSIQASALDGTNVTFDVSGVEVTAWYTPVGIGNFNYVKTLQFTDGETLTLALDDSGTFWQENLDEPNVLTPFFTAIEPDTFAKSVTEDDREFIALSDLAIGTDMPRQYNGQWVDRISQVGPASAPSVTFSTTTYPIVSITQAAATDFSGNNYTLLWSSNAGTTQSGNTITIQAADGLLADVIAAGVGATVVLAGVPDQNGQSPNGTYIVVACGTVPTARYGPASPYFSVTAAVSNKADVLINSGSYQLTLATLTTSTTVPNLQVNSQMTIAGAEVSSYDGTWTVLDTPNASQMSITDTSLSGNVAQYAFDLITGTAPIVGQQVTVTGTSNGNGIFNVVNAVITAVSTVGSPVTGGTFSVAIVSPDITGAAEEGNAIVNGTIFQFDPGQIFGNATTEGTVVVAGGLGAGTRGCVVMFLTRNGLLTAPGVQTVFTLNSDANSITVSNLPIGPPNVIARVVAFTGAGGATQTGGGGFYFWIPSPVTVLDNGQTVVYSATIVNDNVTTQQTFTFTDAVLLAAESITDQGNNNFAQIELGSCLGVIAYSSRLFAWGEQNKVNNLLNYSFDGGIGQAIGSSVVTYPLGWTVDPTNGAGGSVATSPLFGDAYQISNSSGSTQSPYGMITQGAYHDVIGGAPIIFSATTYSVRVTASTPTGTTSGSLVVDLYSPSTTQQWGNFTIPLSSMSEDMAIFTGTLLTTAFQTVPSDLLIRLYATNLPNGATILVDRIEPFPTDQPVLSTQLRASYFDNFEAFDQITGNLGVGDENQQPVTNAFTLFDNLYVVKTKSLYTTTDNGVTEPNGWTVKEVSNKIGTPSIYGVDLGEGWALVAGQAGLYLFEGGEPVKINPELDGDPGLWQSINWTYGNTIWVRNDTERRKIYIGVPIATPNQWMPKFPANANPTQPNVVLCCVYKELMTSGALAGEGPIRLTYTGDLKTYALGRKWSAWSIEACYADFITRPDTTDQIFYCGDADTGKIYQQISGNYADDGAAMFCDYYTYAFPKAQEAQQSGMGLTELEAAYMTLLIEGSGDLDMTIIPNALGSEDAEALYPEPLHTPPLHDTEIPLNQIGNRFFMEFSVDKPFEWFELSRVIMALAPSPWAPVRGTNE